MKQVLIGAIVGFFVGLLLMGCTNPIAADAVRLTFECSTQPRTYISPTGQVSIEVDHYTQDTPCPAVRID